MSTDYPETAATVNIGAISYRAQCTELGCTNLGRMMMIYADAGGRPIGHPMLCHAHVRVRIEGASAAGLKVLRRSRGRCFIRRLLKGRARGKEEPRTRPRARGQRTVV